MMMDEIFIAEMDELYQTVQELVSANPFVDEPVLARIREMVDELAERYQLSADALFSSVSGLLEPEEE